jgi:hypothetical protein
VLQRVEEFLDSRVSNPRQGAQQIMIQYIILAGRFQTGQEEIACFRIGFLINRSMPPEQVQFDQAWI